MKQRNLSGAGRDEKAMFAKGLTRRERQVVGLIALGHTNAEVSNLLNIHQKTVESHRGHIMTKHGLSSRAELVRFAFKQGLVTTGPGGSFFHFCANCKVLWALRSQFLSDHEVKFLGYKPAVAVDAPGHLAFRHERCYTKLDLDLESFMDLAGGPLVTESCAVRGTKVEYCLAGLAASCPLRCVCAYVWRTSRIIKDWPKNCGTG